MESEAIRAAVDETLSNHAVTLTIVLVGPMTRDDDWKCDAWTFVLARGDQSMTSMYYTGIGHRKLPKGVRLSHEGYVRPGTIAAEQNEALKKPVKPHAADILHSLLLDASAMHQSFNDWCSDLGSDNDSIKAFNTYQECCKIGADLSRVLGRDLMEKLRELTEGY